MQKTKRIVSLILAIIIAFGSLAWVLTLLVSAAADDDVWYTLERVYTNIRYKNDADDASTVRYVRGSTSKNDYTITSGRVADFTFTVVDTSRKDTDLSGYLANLKDQGKTKVSIDAGSFKAAKYDAYETEYEIEETSLVPADGSDYYLTYQVVIKGAVYSGTGNTLGFTVESEDPSGKKYTKSFTAEISQSKPNEPRTPSNDDDDDDDDKINAATPYVIVSSYNYGGGQVTAGDTFDLTINFYNTSETIDVENMVMTISTPDAFSLTSSSNTFYISDLESQKTLSKTVKVQAKPSAKPESHAIEVSFRYQYIADGIRKDGDNKESIAIPVIQLDRFAVDPLELPTQMYVGEEMPVTANLVNKGRGDVYNISGEITGSIANPGQRQNLGNLQSGQSDSLDFYIQCTEPGWVNGEVVITYEDINMVIKTISVPYNIEVLSFDDMGPGPFPGEEFPGPEVPPEGEDGSNLGLPIAVGAGVATAVAVILVIRKKRKAALAASEAEDEEF